MTICVDATFYWPGKGPWCHMFDDEGDLTALHVFAARIGLRREWFQDAPKLPHYDLRPSKRVLAVQAGAREVERGDVVLAIRRHRDSYRDYVEAKIAGGLQ